MAENKEFETIDFDSEIDNTKNIENNIENNNIFSEFETENKDNLKNKGKEKKDPFDYLNISMKIFQFLLFISVIWFWVWTAYVQVQNSENFSNKEFLNPICWLLNWDINVAEVTWSIGCSSVSHNKKFLEDEIEKEKKEQIILLSKIVPVIYEKENFLNTKEIQFLNSKSQDKLKVIDILEKFHYLLNLFTWVERKKLQCSDFKIDSVTKILSMKCEAYSRGYTSDVIWFSWKKDDSISGTSISIANSFINFLEVNAWKYFLVIDRQKVFNSEKTLKNGYTNKTDFDLKLKIIF